MHILRVGIAITFLWIGILILKDPEAWAGLMQPWLADLIIIPLYWAMVATAFLDIVVGTLLLIDYYIWLAALVGSIHLVSVLLVVGINALTIRDIGLLAATLALFVSSLPPNYLKKLKLKDQNLDQN